MDDIILFFENKDKKYQDIVDVKEYLLEENNNKDEVIDKVDNQKDEDVIEDEEQIIKEEILKQDEVDIKTCSNCKNNLPLHNFSKNAAKKGGLEPYCKKCATEKYYKSKNKEKIELQEKKCTKCSLIKDICHFYNRAGSSDGKTSECKDCTNMMYKDRITKRDNVEVLKLENKNCLTCNKLLDISNFSNKKDSPDGKMSYCKKCCSENAKNRKSQPKSEISTTKKCNKCLNDLDITCFWNSSSNKDGKDNKCKNCHKENRNK